MSRHPVDEVRVCVEPLGGFEFEFVHALSLGGGAPSQSEPPAQRRVQAQWKDNESKRALGLAVGLRGSLATGANSVRAVLFGAKEEL